MGITNPKGIPQITKTDIKDVCLKIGPLLLGSNMPKFKNSEKPTDGEIEDVFELITREFWRQQIQQYKVEEASRIAQEKAMSDHSSDPFT